MTRNRAAKQTVRRTAAAQGIRYTETRGQAQEPLFEAEYALEWDEVYACCSVVEDMERDLRVLFGGEGVDALVAELDRLAQGALGRDSHFSYGSNHDVMLTANSVCWPLLYRHGIKASDEPMVWNEPLLSGVDRARVQEAYRELEAAVAQAETANSPY
ncbi:hypothetical protein [[Kitasatospora] papulosa]|uniref:hypothetical protein n=1 Tax=[Kitasatospora] papulosa TaxID=1464011 RepID=UPI0036821220